MPRVNPTMTESVQSADIDRTQLSSKSASTAQFVLPADGVAFSDLFERIPNARIEIISTVASPANHGIVVVRADEHERDTVDAALQADSTVMTAQYCGKRSGGWSYHIEWSDRPRSLMRQLTAEGLMLLSVQGYADWWRFRLLASDWDMLARGHEILEGSGRKAECKRISSFERQHSEDEMLTKKQREALIEAFEAGYYDIPRNVVATDLASQLNISHQALSERVRRAHKRLIKDELFVREDSLE